LSVGAGGACSSHFPLNLKFLLGVLLAAKNSNPLGGQFVLISLWFTTKKMKESLTFRFLLMRILRNMKINYKII